MKKFIYILMVMGLLLTGCSSKKEINYIKLDEYVEKINNDSDYVVVVGRIDCGACVAYKPILEEAVSSKNLALDYVEINDSWSDEDRTRLLEETQNAFDFNLTGTPTTLIVKDNKLVEKVSGYLEYKNMIEILKEHDVVE